MPQDTNLNVAPYFDDFDKDKNFYKVLFKPAYPVQARELNNLQSILQNQIEDFGNNIFKEGAIVIPGNSNYRDNCKCVQIQPLFLGIPVSLYLDQLIGKTIKGRRSGITAEVITYITDQESVKGNYTLYVQYKNTSNLDSTTEEFFDNEILETQSAITFSSSFISAGEGFANTVSRDAAQAGTLFSLNEGVFFLRGYFVNVETQLIILDQYRRDSNYRVGLLINEEIVTSDDDVTLSDNAQGFNNYSAPGADRLKITATLAKKPIDDFNDQNFVQIAEIKDGSVTKITQTTKYNELGHELARRTFDESGDYYVKQLRTAVKENLNNYEGNRGIYNPGQITQSGNNPSESNFCYRISPGKAYVRGYEVDRPSVTIIDTPKARTTKTLESQAVNFDFGPQLQLNNVSGSPIIDITTSNNLSLRDQRVGDNATVQPGKEIGLARLYDFFLESGGYDVSNSNINRWDLSLFDIDTFTEITLNKSTDLTVPTYIKGNSSGAVGFIRYAVNSGTAVTAYSINGEFLTGETISFNGETENDRYISNIKAFNLSDVKSVYSVVGSANTFSADVILQNGIFVGIASISANSGGVSTITSPNLGQSSLVGIATVGNIIKFSQSGKTDPNFARVTAYNDTSITIAGVTTVLGVCEGALPPTDITVQDLETVKVVSTPKRPGSNNFIDNTSSIFSTFPNPNISNVDITNSTLIIRQSFSTTIDSSGKTGTINVNDSQRDVFLPFDEERYSLINSDGSTQVITSGKFIFSNGSKSLVIGGLNGPDPDATLVATIRRSNPTTKTKIKFPINSLVISKSNNPASGVGGTSLDDGLEYGNYPFGTRVQDNVLSLNVPDAIKVLGVFESPDVNDPTTPSVVLDISNGVTGTTSDLLKGETLLGQTSNAKALFVEAINSSRASIIYLNNSVFQEGETVTSDQSKTNSLVLSTDNGSDDITVNYDFDTGMRGGFYDFARLTRRSGKATPSRKIKIYFSNAYYESTDTNDITTVNSYTGFDYKNDISITNGRRNTDIIDLRPRVNPYAVSTGSRSPLEFLGRDFDSANNSASSVIANGESITLDYSYFVGRIDRIFVNKDGSIQVVNGTPDDIPSPPKDVSESLEIATVTIPPYVYSVKNIKIENISHKRYQMSDIAKLEQRIQSLEYYTSLNAIESKAVNSEIRDKDGLSRFKSGIFVDNFASNNNQEIIGIKNSVDRKKKILRPSHYCTALNLQVANNTIPGVGEDDNENNDAEFSDLIGNNVRRNQSVVTLDYEEVIFFEQPFATRTESVTPFLVTFYKGSILLQPSEDVWSDIREIEPNIIRKEGNFDTTVANLGWEIEEQADGTRVGVGPVEWGAWETVSSSTSTTKSKERIRNRAEAEALGINWDRYRNEANREIRRRANIPPWSNGIPLPMFGAFGGVNRETTTKTTTTVSERSGTQDILVETFEEESLGTKVVSREFVLNCRSRNITVRANGMKPYTRVYSFFDGVDVNNFTSPKLIEILMDSGTFQVGETVKGRMPAEEKGDVDPITVPQIDFRVANSNHKYGPYNAPTDIYTESPYNSEVTVPPTYSQTSTTLNMDLFSLQSEDNPEFFGRISSGMILVGQTSGARATVTSKRMITDRVGTLQASFRIPDPGNDTNPTFSTGRTPFRLTSSPVNTNIEGNTTTTAEEIFFSEGTIEVTQETTLSLRNARLETREVEDPEGLVTSTSTVVKTKDSAYIIDPLAQTFTVPDDSGVFVTKFDAFFSEKDDNLPVFCQLRETTLGTPNSTILPYSEVFINPENVVLSEDGTLPTTFTFDAPVFLKGNTEYALVLLSKSTKYRVWISRLGETEITTVNNGEAGRVIVTEQPTLGSLFKSQNASVWTPSQYEDLKYTLYRADFVSSGNIEFFNPPLPEILEPITPRGFLAQSQSIRVGIGTTINNTGLTQPLTKGNTILQANNPNTKGNLVGFAGSVTGDLLITSAGVGYTPSSSQLTYTGVALSALSGNGVDATANITISSGVAIAATINVGGKGYQVGDVLKPLTIGNDVQGINMVLTVDALKGNSELIIDDIQGEFNTNDALQFIDNSSTQRDINSGVGGSVFIQAPIRKINDGLHIRVFQRNHGMYSNLNQVRIKNLSSDIESTTLSGDYSATETTSIAIGNTSNFGVFENVGVSNTNPGYARIGSEIIEYTGVNNTSLIGITSRGIDDTVSTRHLSGDAVFKYEFDGVSLRRINKTHNLADVTVTDPIDIDTYHVKIDMSSSGTDRSGSGNFPKLFLRETKNGGGSAVRGTYNLPFNMIIPKLRTIAATGTSIDTQVRTVSATSVSGNEISYLDQGFTPVALDSENYFDTMRMVASNVNQTNRLSNLPGNKSFSLSVNLSTSNPLISPAVDLDTCSCIFVMNRINSKISNYATDPRVNTYGGDPTAFMYITQNFTLQNSATSLQVLFDAYLSYENDIRVFYALNQNYSVDDTIFIPFPGLNNVDLDGNVIDPQLSNGSSNNLITKFDKVTPEPNLNQFTEYRYAIDELPPFTDYRIKIVGTSTNMANVPQLKNLRVLALA